MPEPDARAKTPRKKYRPAITPGLRKLYYVILASLAVLGANSVYLGSITFLGFLRDANYENQFYLYMFLLHLVVGIVMTVPFLVFAVIHMRNTWERRNRKAVRAGYWLFACSAAIIATGFVMTVRVLPLESIGGRITYWLHVLAPVLGVLFYIQHRLFGPRIKWRWGVAYGVATLLFVVGMAAMHSQDPRLWDVRGGGDAYFHPSEARTATNGFIPERALMMDHYCERCHPDAVKDHHQSVHHFSSFNNPPYLFSVRETRRVLLERDGNVQGARFCAGCHDPVPFFSGAFDDPNYDDVNDPTAHAGITCTVCHAITDVAGTVGNANYTIEEPLHYPFAYSENSLLQWVNEQLVKAKPAFHKKTFLKPLHEKADFCATCHKVNLPKELNAYKDWLRGQNHYDNYELSGVSGGGARSFYYPHVAQTNCNECHMPPRESDDFGAVAGFIHDHRFPGANTAIPTMKGLTEQAEYQAAFLQDGQVRVDIFALKEGGTIDGELVAPLRPEVPVLQSGATYLLEVVVRTLKVGHTFTQGTSDSNQLWLDVEVRDSDSGRIVGRSGAVDEHGFVDPWSHFINSLVLDRFGNRIDRRNAQDIFVPLYSNQQPPGTGQVVHYRLNVPEDARGPLEITVALNYRKFDRTYMGYVYDDLRKRGLHDGPIPEFPIVTMSKDFVRLPVGGGERDGTNDSVDFPLWQRWRDYGIGLLRKGNAGSNKGELKQAEVVFRHVAETLKQPDGFVDLARVYEKEGRLEDARRALDRAVTEGVVATWTVNWLTGLIDKQNGHFDAAIASFEKVLATRVPERNFDFSRDYQVRLQLAQTLFLRARQERGDARNAWLDRAVAEFETVLESDAENLSAHYNLMQCFELIGAEEKAAHHRKLHVRYKPDENARDTAVRIYRSKNPAADHAAESVVIYDLHRE